MRMGGPASTFMQQLALDIALAPSYAAEDIAITPANAGLIDMLDAEPELHGAGILLYGPEGSGKTHLAWRWANKHNALFLAPERVGTAPAEILLQGRARVVLDGIERIRHWPALVALLNEIRSRQGQVLVTADAPPGLAPVPLADAQSRLMGLVALGIPDPDDALLEAHLRKRFSDWHWQVEPALFDYLLPRLPRDYSGLGAWMHRLQRMMEEQPKRLTIPLLRPLLEAESA